MDPLEFAATPNLAGTARDILVVDEKVKQHLPRNRTYEQTPVTSTEWLQTYRIDTKDLDVKEAKSYGLMTAKGENGFSFLFASYESMNTLRSIVPEHSNHFLAQGTYTADPNTHFILHSHGYKCLSLTSVNYTAVGHALADLHLKSRNYVAYPAGIFGKGGKRFGYHRQTSTHVFREHRNWAVRWQDFFLKQMQTMVASVREAWADYERDQASHKLDQLVGPLLDKVLRTLLRRLEYDGGRAVEPVLLHGALCRSNIPKQVGGENDKKPIFLNGAVFWGHNEYDLGCLIADFEDERRRVPAELFLKAYHEKIPKAGPQEEYYDRLRLYGLRTLMHKSVVDPSNIVRRNRLIRAMTELVDKYPSYED